MKEKMNKTLKNLVKIGAIAGLSLFVVSCGKKEEEAKPQSAPAPMAPAPGQAPAPAPAPAPGPQGLSSFIEDQVPGTPLDANSWNALSQKLRDNVSFYGSATVASITSIDYSVDNAYSASVKFTRSNQQNLTNSTPTIQIWANGDVIQVQSPYGGYEVFNLYSQISLYGQTLKSTDTVGLYLSGDGSSLLKVQYNTKNPPIQYFHIEEFGGWGSSMRIRVTAKPINTNGTSQFPR